MVTLDIVEYDEETMGKPVFGLILGTKTLNQLGVRLVFKQQVIAMDEIMLPMWSINQMPTSKRKHWP